MNDLFMELPVAHSSSVNAKSGVRTYRQFRWSEVLSDLISKRLDSGKTTNRSTSTNLSVGLRAEIDTLKREFSRLDGQFKQLVSSLGGQISN
jgi:hypothetical protein